MQEKTYVATKRPCKDGKQTTHLQNKCHLHYNRGTRWRSWLRHCATSRKVAGSILGGVIGIFHWHNPSGRTMALGLTQPLTEMSTRNISWGGKGGRCVWLTTLPPSCADCLEIWESQPPGALRACPGLQKDCFTLTLQQVMSIMHFVSGGRGKRNYPGSLCRADAIRFPGNGYKRKWSKITTSVETYTFRNNSGTLAASYRKNERRWKKVYWA